LCGAALGGYHSSCGATTLSWPALALCTDNLTGLDKPYAPLCLHLLHLFLKYPFGAAFVEGRVIASAVWALWLICAVIAGVANLTTCGTSLFNFTLVKQSKAPYSPRFTGFYKSFLIVYIRQMYLFQPSQHAFSTSWSK